MGLCKIHGALAAMALATLPAFPVMAQLDDRTAVSVMLECRKIADVTARVACYDNIPVGPGQPTASASQDHAPTAPAAQGFGSNQLRQTPQAAAVEQITAIVSSATERTPGIYLLTLEDGTQWQFVDSAPSTYEPPRRGSTIEISAASLGSYLLRYDGQRALRARRVR